MQNKAIRIVVSTLALHQIQLISKRVAEEMNLRIEVGINQSFINIFFKYIKVWRPSAIAEIFILFEQYILQPRLSIIVPTYKNWQCGAWCVFELEYNYS